MYSTRKYNYSKTLKDGPTIIDAYVFKNCSKLTTITLEEGLEVVATRVCAGTNITSIIIPSTVKTMEQDAFLDCTELTKIEIYDNVENFYGLDSTSDKVFQNHNDDLTIYCYEGSLAAQYAINHDIKYVYLTRTPTDDDTNTDEDIKDDNTNNDEEIKDDNTLTEDETTTDTNTKDETASKPTETPTTDKEDTTIASGKIPNAGANVVISVAIIFAVLAVIVFYKNKYKRRKKVKKINKILYMIFLASIIIFTVSNVYATSEKSILQIIQKAAERKYLENNLGYIDNAIISTENNEITMKLDLNNVIEDNDKGNTEIYIVISETIVKDSERFSQYTTYIEELAKRVFNQNTKTKIGIIGIKGPIRERIQIDDNNVEIGENDQGTVKGSEENAEIVVNPTNDVSILKNGIENMNQSKTDYYINLQAAIRLAKKSFSEDSKKILISLYDTVPNLAIGVCNQVTYGGGNSQYSTIEEAVNGKNTDIVNNTKSEILSLKDKEIDFILLRPDDTSFDQKWYNGSTGELLLDFDGSSYVQNLYGTIENPTYGKMYGLNNENLDQIVTEYIYDDIISKTGARLKSTTIKLHFTMDVLNNFDLIISNSNVDSTNLQDEGYILWNIGNVETGATETLEYKLKAKDIENTELVEKIINVNGKLELSYINYLDKAISVEVTDSPKFKITEQKEELVATVSYNPSTETTENVTAIIKTNKQVEEVKGWELSEDKTTLTKLYTFNTTEEVHLIDLDGMTEDVTVKIENIIAKKDDTIAKEEIPNAGANAIITIAIMFAVCAVLVLYKKYNTYKDIK